MLQFESNLQAGPRQVSLGRKRLGKVFQFGVATAMRCPLPSRCRVAQRDGPSENLVCITTRRNQGDRAPSHCSNNPSLLTLSSSEGWGERADEARRDRPPLYSLFRERRISRHFLNIECFTSSDCWGAGPNAGGRAKAVERERDGPRTGRRGKSRSAV